MPVNSSTPPARSLIKPLGVPTLTDLDRATVIDIDEALISHQLAHTLAVLAECRHERGKRDHAGLNKQFLSFRQYGVCSRSELQPRNRDR